ncbi:MAG: ABC transporter permease [Bacillota bacterium]
MNLSQGIISAWKGIRSNLLRSALTTLGIVIGVGAVITLIAVGHGAQADISGQIDRLGTNAIMVMGRGTALTIADAEEIERRVPTVLRAVPVLQENLDVRWNTLSERKLVEGVGAGYNLVAQVNVEAGRFFDDAEVERRARVALVGHTVVEDLFAGRWPLGERVQIGGQSFLVIGVLEEQGMQMGQDFDDVIMVPVTTLQRVARTNRVSMLYAQATGPDVMDLATSHIGRIFEVRTGREDAVAVMSQSQIMDIAQAITGTFTIMLASIAGISLLVGGIGIMNIMLVSVRERTREIGIRKAVGARQRDILIQFLVESVVLSMGGGFLGIVLGALLSSLIRQFGLSTLVTPASVSLAFGFSAAVGLFFGVYPAMQASRLDPIQALRYE